MLFATMAKQHVRSGAPSDYLQVTGHGERQELSVGGEVSRGTRSGTSTATTRVLSVRFSGGFAGLGESTTGCLSGPYDAPTPPGVHVHRHASTAVVSTALARSAVSRCVGPCRLPLSAWSAWNLTTQQCVRPIGSQR